MDNSRKKSSGTITERGKGGPHSLPPPGEEDTVRCRSANDMLPNLTGPVSERIDNVSVCQIGLVRWSDTAACRGDGMPRPPLHCPMPTVVATNALNTNAVGPRCACAAPTVDHNRVRGDERHHDGPIRRGGACPSRRLVVGWPLYEQTALSNRWWVSFGTTGEAGLSPTDNDPQGHPGVGDGTALQMKNALETTTNAGTVREPPPSPPSRPCGNGRIPMRPYTRNGTYIQ